MHYLQYNEPCKNQNITKSPNVNEMQLSISPNSVYPKFSNNMEYKSSLSVADSHI